MESPVWLPHTKVVAGGKTRKKRLVLFLRSKTEGFDLRKRHRNEVVNCTSSVTYRTEVTCRLPFIVTLENFSRPVSS